MDRISWLILGGALFIGFAIPSAPLLNGSDGPGKGAIAALGLSPWTPALPAAVGIGSPPTALVDTPARLVAYWPLDDSWSSATGRYDLTGYARGGFEANDFLRGGEHLSYGPTGEQSDNGGWSEALTTIDTSAGITLAGWYFKPDNNTSGILFGFGDRTWGQPALGVYDDWGYLYVGGGQGDTRRLVEFDRPDSGCWHHLAAVFPPGFDRGVPFRFYIDGQEATSSDGAPQVLPSAGLFGAPFRVGVFGNTSGGRMRVDEVSLWSRPLGPEEIRFAAQAPGEDGRCPGSLLPWEPGPLCSFADAGALRVRTPLEVRVLTDDRIAVVTDPTDWLTSKMMRACGDYLREMDEASGGVDEWWAQQQYGYAWVQTRARYWPALMDTLKTPDHLRIGPQSGALQAPRSASHWPQAVQEITLPRASGEGEDVRTLYADTVVFSYLELPFHMEPGQRYTLLDDWGNQIDFSFDLDETPSWALKVDQLGYMTDAPDKHAYLGAWTAQGGSLDLSRFEGQPFEIVREDTHRVVFTGTIRHRMEDPLYEGESVYDMDFSALTDPGSYYVRVPGAGRSWSFTLGRDALGEAFYVHARGLYHNRCGQALTEPYTRWTRGDAHQVYHAQFPPDDADYGDHSSEGWGILDEAGDYVPYSVFEAVDATATASLVPGVSGGWHDAADFDRRPAHLRVVQDLAISYLMFPANFTDSQLNIPESGNGIPDILDEARWGMEVWRRAQSPDGATPTAIEATSHPGIFDPGADTQPYYLSLATRSSSLAYAQHAALLGRALTVAGAPSAAAPFIDSARAAYAFGTDPAVRVTASWERDGHTHTFIEAPEPDAGRRLWATIELWLATGDPAYRAQLDTPAMDQLFRAQVTELWWKDMLANAASVALAADQLPAGWGDAARAAILSQANTWISYQDSHAYRRVWWGEDHAYFDLSAWGHDGFLPLESLVMAWRVSGEAAYRSAALMGVNYLNGANGQGWVNTTGLGDQRATTALHLPSFVDGIDEPSPGITVFGNHQGVPSAASRHVYGLKVDPRGDPPFPGLEMSLMPPPWDGDGMTLDQVQSTLGATIPQWRRLLPLEQNLPNVMEFSVWETVSPAAAVSGCLMGPGWMPSSALKSRAPLSGDELRAMSFILP